VTAFGAAISAAFTAARGVAGRSVVYRRGTTSLPITACPGSSPFAAANIAEISLHANARNYYIAAADLSAFGEPEAGDEIADSDGTYRVAEMDGLPPWTWADNEHLILRLHTKRFE